MVMGAEPAGKPADADFGVSDFHGYPCILLSPGISIRMNHTRCESNFKKRNVYSRIIPERSGNREHAGKIGQGIAGDLMVFSRSGSDNPQHSPAACSRDDPRDCPDDTFGRCRIDDLRQHEAGGSDEERKDNINGYFDFRFRSL